MAVYLALLAAVTVAGIPLCSKRCGKWGRIVYCVIFAIVFIVVSAIRFQVGYDFNTYGGTYYDMRFYDIDSIMTQRMEKGFLLPVYFLSLGFENYYVIFIYTSIVIYSAVFALICRHSEIPWISAAAFMCFGLFFNSLCFLRQFMAGLIIAYALKFAHKGTYLRFLIFVAAAGTFHWSAFIFAVLFILIKIKPSWIYLGTVSLGTVLFCIFSKKAMMFLIDKFYMYKSYDPNTSTEASVGLPPRYTIIFGIIFIICFLFRNKLIEKNPDNSMYLNCLMYTVVFEAMGMRHAVLSRFAVLTYIAPMLFMLPDAVTVIGEWAAQKKGKLLAAISGVAASGFALGCYILLILNNYNGVVPYATQFNRSHDIFVDSIISESDEDTDEVGDTL